MRNFTEELGGEFVTLETVKKWAEISATNKTDLTPIEIDGIPSGFAYMTKMNMPVDHLLKVGYLIAFREGYHWQDEKNRACCYKPIVVQGNATPEDIELEIIEAGKRLVECYKNDV